MTPFSNSDSSSKLSESSSLNTNERKNSNLEIQRNDSRIIVKHASNENLQRHHNEESSTNNLTICTRCSVDSFVWSDECICDENKSEKTTSTSDKNKNDDDDDGIFWW